VESRRACNNCIWLLGQLAPEAPGSLAAKLPDIRHQLKEMLVCVDEKFSAPADFEDITILSLVQTKGGDVRSAFRFIYVEPYLDDEGSYDFLRSTVANTFGTFLYFRIHINISIDVLLQESCTVFLRITNSISTKLPRSY
jgi:hypothetical protein